MNNIYDFVVLGGVPYANQLKAIKHIASTIVQIGANLNNSANIIQITAKYIKHEIIKLNIVKPIIGKIRGKRKWL